MKIPVSDVAAGMAKDMCAVEEDRRQVHPQLVHVHTLTQTIETTEPRTLLPPIQALDTRRTPRQAGEAQIVNAVGQESTLADPTAAHNEAVDWRLARKRGEDVRREH